MALKFRKSVKLAPRVRLNVGSKSVGLSIGGKGLRYTINSRTGSKVTATIPGTGMSISGSFSTKKRRSIASMRKEELKKLQRQYEKMKSVQRVQYEVALYNNDIKVIKSLHEVCEDEIDWYHISAMPAPYEIGQLGPYELAAQQELLNYKPNIIDKIFRKVEKKQQMLKQKVVEAANADKLDYSTWQEIVDLANKIINGDSEAYLFVIEDINPFGELMEYMDRFNYSVSSNANRIFVTFHVNTENVVPAVEKGITETGRLSQKEMTRTAYYNLYQDYVSSCVFRVARDIFAIIPVKEIIVNVMEEATPNIDSNIESNTILSVKFDRHRFNQINFATIDCSNTLTQFDHHMNFLKTKGFKPVPQLS